MCKRLDQVFAASSMRYPWPGVNRAGFHPFDDALEVLRPRISAGQQGELHAVEIRVVEGDVIHHDADKDDASSLGYVAEALHHRFRVSGHVEDGGGWVVSKQVSQFFSRVRATGESVFNIELLTAETQTFRVEVHDAQVRSSQLCKLDDAQPDRPAANDQDRLSLFQPGSLNGMGSDPESLDQRQLVG